MPVNVLSGIVLTLLLLTAAVLLMLRWPTDRPNLPSSLFCLVVIAVTVVTLFVPHS